MEECGDSTSAEATAATIFDLPLEDIVMTHIVKHLNMSDLLNLRCTSRAFKGLTERIWGEQKSLIISCTSMRRTLDNEINSKVFCMAVQNCQRLRVIRLENLPRISNEKLATLIRNNPHIREFIISCGDERGVNADGLYPLTQCTDLVHLEIRRAKLRDSFLKEFAKNSILLQRIYFRSVSGCTGKALAAFFAKQYNLVKITLHTLLVYLHPSLLAIGGNCQELEEIDVRDCRNVTDMGILKIAEKCPKIHTILFSSSDDPIDPSLPLRRKAFRRWASVSRSTLDYLKSRNITRQRGKMIWFSGLSLPAQDNFEYPPDMDMDNDSDDEYPYNRYDTSDDALESDDSDNDDSDGFSDDDDNRPCLVQ